MTTGVVSRIEHQLYVHSFFRLFAIQVDAAINAGNSGGPALSADDRIVGVTMQGRDDADNIAYLIPTPVIRHFLEDVEDGRCDGFPTLGIQTQALENQMLRERYGIGKKRSGMLVRYVIPGCASDGHLLQGDIVLKIDDFVVANDETVAFRDKERTDYRYCIERKQIGQSVELAVFRKGGVRKISIPLTTRLGDDRLVNVEYDRQPTYFIHGGFVFCPLTINYLTLWGDDDWMSDVPPQLRIFISENWKRPGLRQVVVLNKVLPTDGNTGYHDYDDEVVESIDGKKIGDFEELVEALQHENGKRYVELVLQSRNRIVISHETARKERPLLQRVYGIEKDRSGDL
jgi:hypothetical protein